MTLALWPETRALTDTEKTERAAVWEVGTVSPFGEYSTRMVISHPSAAELAAGYIQYKLRRKVRNGKRTQNLNAIPRSKFGQRGPGLRSLGVRMKQPRRPTVNSQWKEQQNVVSWKSSKENALRKTDHPWWRLLYELRERQSKMKTQRWLLD